jgi:hypothetical protein
VDGQSELGQDLLVSRTWFRSYLEDSICIHVIYKMCTA